MSKEFNVLVAGRDKTELAALERILREQTEFKIKTTLASNGHFDPLHDITVLPDLVILCLSDAWQDELQQLACRSPATRPPVIIIADASNEREAMLQAMHAGARDFFTRPVKVDSIIEALNKLADESSAAVRGGPQITAVVNAKGGSGATLLAANLAHVLVKEGRQKVALIDLDIQFGTLSMYLDIHPSMGITEVLEYEDEVDAVALKAYMTRHESGIYVLATTHNNVVLPREIDIDRLNSLLTTLQSSFDHIIVDLPRQIDLMTTTVLERADNVVIVTQQSLIHMRDTIRLRSILKDELGIDETRMMVVVNRFDSNDAITLGDINTMLKDGPVSLVPNDYKRVSENVNLGIPLYKQSRHSAITKAIVKLASRLSNRDVAVQKQGVFSRMVKRLHGTGRLDA